MLEEYSKLMDYCSTCPRLCQSACPVVSEDGNESHSPWGLMQTLNLVRRGEIEFDEEVAELSYHCLNCLGCKEQCEHGNEIPPVLHEVRKLAVEKKIAPLEMKGYLAKFHKHNNPFSKDLLHQLRDLLGDDYFTNDFSTIYYPGCSTIAKCSDVISDTFELFKKLKIDFVGAYPETIQCCGYPLVSGGMERDFVDIAEVNYEALKKYKTIISGSPACVYTLKETYKKYDFELSGKVMTINEFLEPHLNNINFKIKKNISTQLMYHDPCYLSRYLGEVERPREMMALVSGSPPGEFHLKGTQTGCSGQGGCYSILQKDISEDIAKRRLAEVYEKNVGTVVTQCPSCIYKFRKNSDQLVVKDLVSYLNDCIQTSTE